MIIFYAVLSVSSVEAGDDGKISTVTSMGILTELV